jgi:pimeloyl-ACP methyl ester carboxylesterase
MKRSIEFAMAAALVAAWVLVVPRASADAPGWMFKSMEAVPGAPGLVHSVWEMERPPYGPMDKIALHRLVDEGLNRRQRPHPKKVVFIIPGTWSRAPEVLDDPTTSTNLFLALNGYDVYTMDFRTKYVPNLAYDQFATADILPTTDWTYGVFREDIKACIDKAKQLSRAKKIFLAGRSRGGTQMYIYASKYWREDLKGLIGLDGGGVWANAGGGSMTEAEYDAMIAAFKAGLLGPYLSEVGGYEQAQYAGAVPYSTNMVGETSVADYALTVPPPPDGSTLETVSDVVAYGAYFAWGAGLVTNYYTPFPGGGGETYMDEQRLISIMSLFTRYWPAVQDVEGYALGQFVDTPFLDYDDHVAEIDLPILFFGSELGCPAGSCLPQDPETRTPKTASDDVTIHYLPGYGHLDVYAGTHSLEDVKQPFLEWMNDRN